MNTPELPYRPKSCGGCGKTLRKTSTVYPVSQRTDALSPGRAFVLTVPLCGACYSNSRPSAAVLRKARAWILAHPCESLLHCLQRCYVCGAEFEHAAFGETLWNRKTGELRGVCAGCDGLPPPDAARGSAAA